MPGSAAEPWRGARGVCNGQDPSVPAGGGGCWSPAGPGACGDGAVLCCSSRRVGGVVPVEPVLGDLRARGQDQDAAVRGPAARRESLRGPRAAGQALQYRELPGSVPSSPPAPPSPRQCQETAPAESQGRAPSAGLQRCEGWVAPPWGPGTAHGHMGAVTWGASSCPRWTPRWRASSIGHAGGSSSCHGQGNKPGVHGGAGSFPPHFLCLVSPWQAQRWHWGGTGMSWGTGEVAGGGKGGWLWGLSVRGWQCRLLPFLLCVWGGCGGGYGVSAVVARDVKLGLASPWGPHMRRGETSGGLGAGESTLCIPSAAAPAGMCHPRHVDFPVAAPRGAAGAMSGDGSSFPPCPAPYSAGSRVWQGAMPGLPGLAGSDARTAGFGVEQRWGLTSGPTSVAARQAGRCGAAGK